MLDDSGVWHILVLEDDVGVAALADYCLDHETGLVEWRSLEPANGTYVSEEPVFPDQTAMIFYTSGSGGHPVGVDITHRNMLNLLTWMWRDLPFREDDLCCQHLPLTMTDAVWELFAPLLQGIPQVLIPACDRNDPDRLLATVAARGIKRLVAFPSLLMHVLEHDDCGKLNGLRHLISIGEEMSPELARWLAKGLPNCALFNLYGATETGGRVTCSSLEGERSGKVGPHSYWKALAIIPVSICLTVPVWPLHPVFPGNFILQVHVLLAVIGHLI